MGLPTGFHNAVHAASGALDWRALEHYQDLLVRRVADRDEWVIAGRSHTGGSNPEPPHEGATVGHIAFGHTTTVDHVTSRFLAPPVFGSSSWWKPDLLLRSVAGEWELLGSKGDGDPSASDTMERLQRTHKGEKGGRILAEWMSRTSKERYLHAVEQLQRHIQRGDIYEVNYCTERNAVIPGLDPFQAFERLLRHTDAPFAALYRRGHHFALCMSPERFLRVEGSRLITQPMKGTRRRAADTEKDHLLAGSLAADPKERSENIMAVDVARHDLSRIAAPRSVHVDELCAVKTYAQVHQLVSTVSARLRPGLGLSEILYATFPMASMTGAPKRRALVLIDEVEDMPRGLFSGSIGYRLPDGTVDLNVVIRTITFDASTGQASLITGSAITALSDPEQEWQECELKARSVLDALN